MDSRTVRIRFLFHPRANGGESVTDCSRITCESEFASLQVHRLNLELQYHFDTKAFIPLAFEYTGCGGNENNFKSEGECRNFCVGYDYVGCAAGSKELETVKGVVGPCSTDKDCVPNAICINGGLINHCCDKKITKDFEADWNPKCPKGTKVHEEDRGGIPITVVGKTCKSKFCPAGAKCVEGTYFATCCK